MKALALIIALTGFATPAAAQLSFGPPNGITNTALRVNSVHAVDLDGDGDNDVLTADWIADKIAWYENLGGGTFGRPRVITTAANGANDVLAIDLDGDTDLDVLSASQLDDTIAWYENLGGGVFGPEQVITNAVGAKWWVRNGGCVPTQEIWTATRTRMCCPRPRRSESPGTRTWAPGRSDRSR